VLGDVVQDARQHFRSSQRKSEMTHSSLLLVCEHCALLNCIFSQKVKRKSKWEVGQYSFDSTCSSLVLNNTQYLALQDKQIYPEVYPEVHLK